MLGTWVLVGCAAGLWLGRWSRDRRSAPRRAGDGDNVSDGDHDGDADSAGGERRPRDPLARAFSLLAKDEPDAAIDVLDDIDTRALDGKALSHWLNLKANALALVERSDEALELLDDLESIADAQDVVLQLCLVGNRALAHLMARRLDLAAQLLDDTEAVAHSLAATAPDFSRESVAESWYWRAAIAERRQDPARRRHCLEQAAALGETPHALKAKAALQKL